LQLFYNDILSLNWCSHCVEISRARMRGSKLKLLDHKLSLLEITDEEKSDEIILNLSRNVKKDLEDIVVANVSMENVLVMNIKVPPTLNKQNAVEYATMEISRNLGILPEQLVVAPLDIRGGEGLFFVSKVDQVKSFVTDLMKKEFPETDVVIPDIVKYLEVFEFYFGKRLKGTSVLTVISFLSDYYSIVVLENNHYRSLRLLFSMFWDYMDIVVENTGIQPKELIEGTVNVDLSFLQPYFGDFLIELDREVKVSLDEVNLSRVNQFFYIVDPPIFSPVLSQSLEKFEGVALKQGIVPSFKPGISLGTLGLMIRGGREIGKVKHLSV